MMLLDSNIIIYSIQPENGKLRDFIKANRPAVSAISLVEVLGFHRLGEADRLDLEQHFTATLILDVNDSVIRKAVELRQMRKMSLGDSIIAATAVLHG